IGVAYFLHTFAGLCAVVLVIAIAPFAWGSMNDLPLLYIALVTVVVVPAQVSVLAWLRGRERHGWYAWVNAGQVAIVTLGGIVVLLLGADVRTYLLFGLVLSATSTFLCWRLTGFRPKLPPIDAALFRDCKQFLRGGFPFYVCN